MSIFEQQPTIFGGNTGMTYEDVQRKRKLVDQLAYGMGKAPKNVGEGLNAIGNALLARSMQKKADKRDAELRGEFDSKWDGLFGGGASTEYNAGYMPTDTMAAASGIAAGGSGERELLAKTLMAEAGGEGLDGMLAAGAVIKNRVGAGGYGENLKDVIMKPGQFSAWNGVTGYAGGEGALDMSSMTPNDEALRAADLILSGQYEDPTGGATHYYNPSVANPKWGQSAGGEWSRIGNHVFGNADAGRGVQVAQNGPMDIQAMAEIIGSPYASEGQKAIVRQLMQQQMQSNDPQRQLAMQLQQAQLDKLKNPQVDPLDEVRLKQAQLDYEQDLNPEPDKTASMQEYELAKSQGFDGTFTDYKQAIARAGASSVSVTTGDEVGRYIYGTKAGLPNGWRLDTQTGNASRIPNGPAEVEAAEAEASNAVADENKERSGAVVTEDIDRALKIVGKNGNWATGFGAILKGVPGTQAKSLDGILQTIKANVGFDRLQQMRDASVTGGALGAINKTEMDLLQSVLGNLEQSLDPDDLAYNLRRINEVYLDIINGPGNRPDVGKGGSGDASPDFSGMDAKTIWDVDIGALDSAGMDAYEARLKELGL